MPFKIVSVGSLTIEMVKIMRVLHWELSKQWCMPIYFCFLQWDPNLHRTIPVLMNLSICISSMLSGTSVIINLMLLHLNIKISSSPVCWRKEKPDVSLFISKTFPGYEFLGYYTHTSMQQDIKLHYGTCCTCDTKDYWGGWEWKTWLRRVSYARTPWKYGGCCE
jgi:hypothetical protein